MEGVSMLHKLKFRGRPGAEREQEADLDSNGVRGFGICGTSPSGAGRCGLSLVGVKPRVAQEVREVNDW